MKAVLFDDNTHIDDNINYYLNKGWLVHSITPKISSKFGDSGTTGYLVIFDTRGIAV